jgi:hypothetical protein
MPKSEGKGPLQEPTGRREFNIEIYQMDFDVD